MSYTLHIWDEPIPATLEEADRIASKLRKEPPSGGINQKYAEAAIRLTERYPFYDDPDVAPDEMGEVWSGGPLTPRNGERLWGVGILSQYANEVQPFVVATSNTLGLVVYDFQLGKAYLPGGEVLGNS